MDAEATQMLEWLKAELADWFTAETDGSLDVVRYFVYDDEWNTLLGLEESFASHQQLNDHHFHYGYFVRAAAEICRMEQRVVRRRSIRPDGRAADPGLCRRRRRPDVPVPQEFRPCQRIFVGFGSRQFRARQ